MYASNKTNMLFHILHNIRNGRTIYQSSDAITNNKLYVPAGKRNVVYSLVIVTRSNKGSSVIAIAKTIIKAICDLHKTVNS